ncbi:MAG TPA: hypothetical protein VIX35_12845 [Vicinamibacterales bacterium]
MAPDKNGKNEKNDTPDRPDKPDKSEKASKAPTFDELARQYADLSARVAGVRRGL